MKKKKRFYRILSFMFCCMFFLFAGCSASGGSGNGDNVAVLAGTKVLTRPAGYSFSDAVGVYSENYYNLFAANILNLLYLYQVGGFRDSILNPHKEGYQDIQGENTYGKFENNQQYYLFDTQRYTIEKVESFYDASKFEKDEVTLKLSKNWNWTIEDVAGNGVDDIFFKKIVANSADYVKTNDTVVVTINANWLDFYNYNYDTFATEYPNFLTSYVGGVVQKTDVSEILFPEGINDYYKSPYYEKEVEGTLESAITSKNYFQDALEYAIYMFVLGYDYHTYDKDGNVVEGAENAKDSPYFDFNITYGTDGYVSGMTVNGWGNNVAITDALKIAKERYQEIGGYVGVVEKNIQQVTRFILEKIIGSNSPDAFTVDMVKSEKDSVTGLYKQSATQPDDLTFNRNYSAIVNNIVRYSCEQVPIGYSYGEDGKVERLSLNNGFSASMITEYKGNYFFANYDVLSEGTYLNDDSEIFKNIDAAEYQSMVIYPDEDLIGKALGGLWLDFEYFENEDPTKTMLVDEGLTVNVGFRYYDHKQNKVVVDKQVQKKIRYGKNGTQKDENGEDVSDESLFMIGDDKNGPDDMVSIEEGSVIFREFNNKIGGGVLDPFANGSEIVPPVGGIIGPIQFKASKYLTGLDNARNYYKLNNSQTAGQYGTLNEAMFAGDDGCSFIEIYFDIDKDPSKSGICYDFKVCLRYVGEHEDVNAMPDIGDDFE